MNRKIKKIIPIFGILIFIYVLTLRARPKKSLVHMPNYEDSIDKSNINNGNKLSLFGDEGSKVAEFDTKTIKYVPQESILQIYKSIIIENPNIINWNRLAYVFYATSPDNLYPVLVNIRQLVNFDSKAKFHLIYSFDLNENLNNQSENIKFHKIIKLLKNKYNVEMVKYNKIQSKFDKDSTNWSDSFTKLWAFSLTQYDRVIYLDADSIINNKMDQLFFLPPSLLSVPINYINHPKFKKPSIIKSNKKLNGIELPPTPLEYSVTIKDLFKNFIENEMNFDDKFYNKFYNSLPSMENTIALFPKLELCSYVMVIMPDEKVFNWILKIIDEKKPEEYDMEIINNIWKISDINNNNYIKRSIKNENLANHKNPWLKSILVPSLTILPHEPYALLSGEFKSSLFEHAAYLTNPNDFGYLTKSQPLLSIQRSIKNGNNYKNIEEAVESYPEIPYWDWAWRFDYEGNVIKIKELESDIEIDKVYNEEKQINKRNDYNNINDEDEEEVDFGMGIAKFGWDSKKIVEDSVYIHWSDWPLGKPWEFEQNNENNNDDSLWLFEKIADENLTKCKSEINDFISTLKFAKDSKEGQLLEKERKFAIRTCDESIESWKKIYRDYWNNMLEVMEEIYE